MDHRQAVGCFLGLALGDAMGAPLEGLPAPAARITRPTSGGLHNLRIGEYTDDTLQAAAVATSLVVCRGFEPYDLMQRLIRAYLKAPRFFGPTSSAVFEFSRRGIDAYSAARLVHQLHGGSRSNGSVMRGPPIGIFYRPSAVRDASIACSRLTHCDRVAAECSAFVNLMASLLCRGVPREAAFTHALHACGDPHLADLLAAYGRHPLDPSLDAAAATHCAIACFMDAESAAEAILRAINLGGDADTIGAIAGSLAGAAWGVDSLPIEWLVSLQDAPVLSALAIRLAASARP